MTTTTASAPILPPGAVEFFVPDPDYGALHSVGSRRRSGGRDRRSRSSATTAAGGSASRGPRRTGSSTCSSSTASLGPDPRNPLRRPGRSATSRSSSGPSTSRRRGSTRRPTRGRSRRSRSDAAGSSRAFASCCTRRPTRPPTTRRSSSRTTGRSTRGTRALTRFLDVMSWEEQIPPLRAALIQPVDRNETYSASALYAAALVRELLPEIARRAPHRRRIGMGASLGAPRDAARPPPSPARVRRLLLQSGSFFRQRSDQQEQGFARYRRITRFVGHACCAPRTTASRTRSRSRSPAGRPRRTSRTTAPSRQALDEQGYPVWLGRGARRAHLDVLARLVLPAPADADRGGDV